MNIHHYIILGLGILVTGPLLAQSDDERPALPNEDRAIQNALQEVDKEEAPATLSGVEVFGTPNPDNLPGLGTDTAPTASEERGVQIGPDYSRPPVPTGDGVFPDSELETVQPVEVVRKPY